MTEETSYIQVIEKPFKGLKLILNDDTFVMASIATSSLILKTKRFSWERGICPISPRELFWVIMDEHDPKSVATKILKGFDTLLAQIIIYHRVSCESENKVSIDEIKFTPDLCALILRAKEEAKREKRDFIWTHHLLLAFFISGEKTTPFIWTPNHILRQALCLTPSMVKKLSNKFFEDFSEKEELKS